MSGCGSKAVDLYTEVAQPREMRLSRKSQGHNLWPLVDAHAVVNTEACPDEALSESRRISRSTYRLANACPRSASMSSDDSIPQDIRISPP